MVDAAERLEPDDVRLPEPDLLLEDPLRLERLAALRPETRNARPRLRIALELVRLELPLRELLLFDALFFIKVNPKTREARNILQ